MHIFATVGSTRFDLFVKEILSSRTLKALKNRGYTTLTVQCGNSNFEQVAQVSNGKTTYLELEGIPIELWKFKPTLKEEYEKADLIISHAGSGTIVEILRLPKPLIVVPNPTLLHNHQEELAQALEAEKYLKSSTVENLANTITQFSGEGIVPFPAFDGSRFRRILDEEMGFV